MDGRGRKMAKGVQIWEEWGKVGLGTGVRGNCGEGRERGKLKLFELNPTVRMEVMVKK